VPHAVQMALDPAKSRCCRVINEDGGGKKEACFRGFTWARRREGGMGGGECGRHKKKPTYSSRERQTHGKNRISEGGRDGKENQMLSASVNTKRDEMRRTLRRCAGERKRHRDARKQRFLQGRENWGLGDEDEPIEGPGSDGGG